MMITQVWRDLIKWNILFLWLVFAQRIESSCSSQSETSKLCRDGGWSLWAQWTMCSKTCNLPDNPAIRYRSRVCNNPTPQHGGTPCPGASSETVRCSHLSVCDVDGGFTDWEVATTCQPIRKGAKCSPGQRDVKRFCTNPKPSGNGKQCRGRILKQMACWYEVGCKGDLQPPKNIFYYRNKKSLELHWQRTPWGKVPTAFELSYWAEVSPNDKQTVTVIVNKWHPYGENYTRVVRDKLSVGKTYVVQITSFNSENHVKKIFKILMGPVDGRWSDWGFWSDCTSPCDRGMRTRTRTCTNPSPAEGGNSCQGESRQSQTCYSQCYRT